VCVRLVAQRKLRQFTPRPLPARAKDVSKLSSCRCIAGETADKCPCSNSSHPYTPQRSTSPFREPTGARASPPEGLGVGSLRPEEQRIALDAQAHLAELSRAPRADFRWGAGQHWLKQCRLTKARRSSGKYRVVEPVSKNSRSLSQCFPLPLEVHDPQRRPYNKLLIKCVTGIHRTTANHARN